MKKIKGVLTACCVCIVCLLLLTACSSKLSAPSSFQLDQDTLTLRWNKVKSASAYTIEIGDVISVTTRDNRYSLENLEPGEYVIKIRAISYSDDYEESDVAEYTFVREKESGLRYKLNPTRDSYTLVGIGEAGSEVVMDDYYRGKPVTSISKAALRRCNRITSFVIGNNVTSIGDNAFYACPELTSVTFPEGLVSIGEGAFQSCTKLESVTIPDGVTELKPYTFSMCKGLKSVSIGAGVTKIGKYVFSDCVALESVELSDGILSLDEYVFSGCNALSQVTFGDNVQTIAKYAFYGCTALANLQLNENLVEIGEGAFQYSGVTELVMPDSLEVVGSLAFAGCVNLNQVTTGAGLKSIGQYAFSNTGAMNTCTEDVFMLGDWIIWALNREISGDPYVIPENVVGIADTAFVQCNSLSRLKMDNVKYIGQNAFANCGSLWELECSDSLLEIGKNAFEGCGFLRSVKLGNCVERIGDYAFKNCTFLEDGGIQLPATLVELGYGAFNGDRLFTMCRTSIVYVDDWVVGIKSSDVMMMDSFIKEGTRGICNYALMYAKFGDGELFIPDSVEIIGKGAFYQNRYLVSTNIPANLKYIGDYAFFNCPNAKFSAEGLLNIPEGCTYLGSYAFRSCNGIYSLSIPGTVKHIGNYAFMGCSNLGAPISNSGESSEAVLYGYLSLGEGIESIGMQAFHSCDMLRSVKLPDSLKELNLRVFYKCSALQSVEFGAGLEEIPAYTFYDCTALQAIDIPGNIRSIGKYAFRGCTSVESITLADGVEKVDDYAFIYCEGTERLAIADSVTHIGDFAFRGLSKVGAIYLGENLTYVGKLAFYGSEDAAIYYEGTEIPATWHKRWNSSFLPIVLGAELSEDNSYVVSWTATENGLQNLSSLKKLTNPSKDGYDFVGWSTVQDSQDCQYNILSDVPVGTKVYAVWTESEEVPETGDQVETQE